MDNKTLHDQFRHQLTNVHGLTVLSVSLLEIVGYIILILSDVETFSLQNAYLWYGVVAPIALNAVTHFTARFLVHHPSVPRARKNQIIIAAALITSLIVAIIHKEYIVSSCAFIFPMVLSAMFNDRKLLNTSFFASVCILICVGAAFLLERSVTLATGLNLFVLLGFAWISYLCGIISINFSRLNYTTIESQARQNDRLKEDARRDQMTGLYNHAAFVSRLDEIISVDAGDETVCLAMLDVDDFKHINDTYGHDCGDIVLITLADIIKKHCEPYGTAYRYGGEEFVILFQGLEKRAVCGIVERMLDDFSAQEFPFTSASITFSAGVSALRPGITRDEFFESADQTLYRAKRAGKNRVFAA